MLLSEERDNYRAGVHRVSGRAGIHHQKSLSVTQLTVMPSICPGVGLLSHFAHSLLLAFHAINFCREEPICFCISLKPWIVTFSTATPVYSWFVKIGPWVLSPDRTVLILVATFNLKWWNLVLNLFRFNLSNICSRTSVQTNFTSFDPTLAYKRKTMGINL